MSLPMAKTKLTLTRLWEAANFHPNRNQEQAIRHVDGPLYLPAGPGSGKTRVLLWRTLNLLVFHGVDPDQIFLSTFTEKAALQLREGLRALLGLVSLYTDRPFDVSRMYVGTVHSLCQRILTDRRFSPERRRVIVPSLLDDLSQYIHVSRRRQWEAFTDGVALGESPQEVHAKINTVFNVNSVSKHNAVSNCIALFNRLSEECIAPTATNGTLEPLMQMYGRYLDFLASGAAVPRTDFSLLQQQTFDLIGKDDENGTVFRHVIIDEYQDTNTIQERIFFQLALGHHNLCVVGDDDQALYRFRGATVENFVEFPQRCMQELGGRPTEIPFTNYRSREPIVNLYKAFIEQCDWRGANGGQYRVAKKLNAHRKDEITAVAASTPGHPDDVCAEIAVLCRQLIDQGKVENENQIAFLFPSLKSLQTRRMMAALEAVGLEVYAPRAGRFLEVEEAVAVFGILLHIFGKPARGDYPGQDYRDFHIWIDDARAVGKALIKDDRYLKQYVDDRQTEIETAVSDLQALMAVVSRRRWDLTRPYDLATMKRPLYTAPGLSARGKGGLGSSYFERLVQRRAHGGRPITLDYAIKRATSIAWNVLDVFYRLCGFDYLNALLDRAEKGTDEGPACNLGLISQYLARFVDEYTPVISAAALSEGVFRNIFFSSYLYTLFRRGEGEYEDVDDPFPRGRIPFLTIHQAKGLEFPVVVFANPRKNNRGPQAVEMMVHPLLARSGEPLDRMAQFDIMRMFYVALSRAKNLLVVAHFQSRGNFINSELRDVLDEHCERIPEFDVSTVPAATVEDDELPRSYSYTGDYLLYQKCPRQYMIFKKYGFVPSRSQTMLFGTLVHRTLEDLHHYLIAGREAV